MYAPAKIAARVPAIIDRHKIVEQSNMMITTGKPKPDNMIARGRRPTRCGFAFQYFHFIFGVRPVLRAASEKQQGQSTFLLR